jgi:outer membrane biosynthesis protein TonB
LEKPQIRGVINGAKARLSNCYASALGYDGSIVQIIVSFTVAADGSVSEATGTGDAEVVRCAAAVLRSLRFPKPLGGGLVRIHYPFNFRTAQDLD